MPSDQKPADSAGQNQNPAPPVQAEDSLEAQPAAATNEPAGPANGAKKSLGQRLPIKNNLYLIVFIILVLAVGAVIYVGLKSSKSKTSVTKAGSLTDQQLASLKGNTTLVGDSKQTLDVQSNSIFEGQVLLRSDLSVAGALKIGGNLSLPSITVGGNGSFGQVGISGGLNVAGDATVQGQLTVQKNLTVGGSGTFGSLNVSNLAITSLQLRGDISLNQHIITSGGIPGRSGGTALGGGGTVSVNGSDTAGTISVNTGSGPPAGCFVTVNFVHGFASTPHVIVSPSNSSAASLQYYTNRGASSFSLCTANAPAGGANYIFDYVVLD
jgi:hypothetical protein